MAPDDFWTRKRKEEEREEEAARERAEEEARKLRKAGPGKTGGLNQSASATPDIHDFSELFKLIPPLLEQVDQLYRQFASGVLERPPIEQRARLEHMITQFSRSGRASPADKFRFEGIINSYSTHKNRWDKLLSDIESGKIKRIAAPKKGGRSF